MKIALIVQRFGSHVLGGSETLARQYARLMSSFADVEVITTCAIDHITWRNHFRSGCHDEEGVRIRRFAVDRERGKYWDLMCRLLGEPVDLQGFSQSPKIRQAIAARYRAMPHALQQEIVVAQGPMSSGLFDHLQQHQEDYDAFLFFTYLYPPCHVGMQLVPQEKIYFCPTLHREPLAYLPIYGESFHRARRMIYLTHAERRFAERLHRGIRPGSVVGMAIDSCDTAAPAPSHLPKNYLLYSGRIEPPKGLNLLFDNFLAFKARYPSDLKLVLMGKSSMYIPPHPDIVMLGFVDEATKFAVMRDALALVQPSPFESFSIVLLESLSMGTPVLVNGHCPPLVEHTRRSGAGFCYHNGTEFNAAVLHLARDKALRQSLGRRGQRYVQRHFTEPIVTSRLREVFEGHPFEPTFSPASLEVAH